MEEFELEPGETITLLVRKHWYVLVSQVVALLIAAILPLLIFPAFIYLTTIQPIAMAKIASMVATSIPYLRFALAFYWLFIWMLIYSVFIKYYLTVWIITTIRIVDVHQYGFFSRKVSSFLLNRVQDVTVDMEGMVPTLFSFGSLEVETAGRSEQFGMYDIDNPQKIRDLIMREVDALNGGAQGGSSPRATTGV